MSLDYEELLTNTKYGEIQEDRTYCAFSKMVEEIKAKNRQVSVYFLLLLSDLALAFWLYNHQLFEHLFEYVFGVLVLAAIFISFVMGMISEEKNSERLKFRNAQSQLKANLLDDQNLK